MLSGAYLMAEKGTPCQEALAELREAGEILLNSPCKSSHHQLSLPPTPEDGRVVFNSNIFPIGVARSCCIIGKK